MEQKRKTAVGIPYDEFHKVWESKFDQRRRAGSPDFCKLWEECPIR